MTPLEKEEHKQRDDNRDYDELEDIHGIYPWPYVSRASPGPE